MQKIDAHQHFWKYNHTDYSWMDDRMEILKKDYLPNDLKKTFEGTGFSGSIAVQARQKVEENQFLLELSEEYDFIKGVVGWVDLQSFTVDEQLEYYSGISKFCGVRHVIHDEPDDDFMLKPAFLRGVSLLGYYGLTYDILVFPKHLVNTIRFVEKFPGQKFVIDHIAKPPIGEGTLEPWASLIREVGQHQNVWCKVSGMVTEGDWFNWSRKTFIRYLEVVYQAFGPDRLMIGSDWPVCRLAGEYPEVMRIVEEFINPADEEKILGQNALEFYGVESG